MSKSTVETLVWVLIYGGLLTVCVAIFVLQAGADGLGWGMVVAGSLATAAGAALIVLRWRMEVATADKKGSKP